ncbi:hypothetical protein [uncultured Mediterranean phage uvDeep-CGR2-KM21-C345]|nr:hypothetical protein [uncultured Mediterranean phage uvDeep-CGR2-KM21-C345]
MSITIKNLHKDLPEDQLHEGKGFTTASNNTYLKKNHEGSSEWLSESWLQPVKGVVSGSSAPPSESSGDRYILTGSSFHANWDSPSQFEIVEFNGTSWIGQAAVDGMRVADLSDDSVYYFNTAWVQSGDTDTTYTAGDGLDLTSTTFSIDAKANGGLVIESTELAVDLGASSITGTLAVSDGGTGAATHTANGVLIGNGTSAIASVDMSTKGHILIGDGSGNPSMLAIGSNDHVLTADSSEATGVKWAAAAGGGGGATTMNGLTDITTTSDQSIFIMTGGHGNAPVTGTLSTAADNIAIGNNALDAITSADYNIAIGLDAGTALTTSAMNVMIGRGAGAKVSTGTGRNVLIGGYDTGGEITTQTDNVCIGYEAGSALTSSSNVTIGYAAGKANSTAGCNTFVGNNAGTGATGQQNVAIGYLAANSASFSGNFNVAIGSQRQDFTSGTGNVEIGQGHSTTGTTTGSYNVAIGYLTGVSAANSNQIAIGNDIDTDGANKIRLGNASIATCNIQTDWTIDSDERIKDNIEDSALGLGFINALRPVTFTKKHPADWDSAIIEKRYKSGGSQYDDAADEIIRDEFDDTSVIDGLIAQEVKSAMDSLGINFSGWSADTKGKQGVQYAALVVPLIKAVQELSAKVEALENA